MCLKPSIYSLKIKLYHLYKRLSRWSLSGKLDLIRKAIELNTLTQRFLHLTESTLEFYYRGKKVLFYMPDADTDSIQQTVLTYKRFYEYDVLEVVRQKTKNCTGTVVDVGANVGNHTLFFSLFCPFTQCVSVEPNPQAFKTLKKNIQLNTLEKKVTLLKQGLSDKNEDMSLSVSDQMNIGATRLEVTTSASDQTISMTTLDALNLTDVGCIKIDVEGLALSVLKGAQDTLNREKPLLFVELLPEEYKACHTLLKSMGYRQSSIFPWDNYIYEHDTSC